MNKLLPDLSEWDYRNDRLDMETPTLNASTAKELIQSSPLHAWQFHPRLGGSERESSDALENGSLIHALLLGAGREVVGIDAKDWRTNAAKEAREAARAEGKIPVLASKLTRAESTVAVLKRRIADAGVQFDGQSEITGVWRSAGDVLCRCRFDHLPAAPSQIVELKTCESAHPDAIRRSIEMFGYDLAAAAYVEALEAIRPEVAGEVTYRWIFVECDAPHAVTIVERAPSMIELGHRRWSRAVGIWKTCLASSKWPSYTTGIIDMEASEFAIKRETEVEYNANPGADF